MKFIYLFFLIGISLLTLGRPLATTFYSQPIIRNDTSYHIIKCEANTYGYEIWVKNKLLIRQKSIPGLPGNRGFSKKQAAVKTARLVIKKLQQGIMPPTITPKDLDSLGVH